MPQNQPTPSVENNFIAGLKTEFTGLNFPENAATDTQNCVYTLIGDVLRREGFDYEANFVLTPINRGGVAVNTYKWNNVGGDGLTQVIVLQVGGTLFFFQSSLATVTTPLSATKLASTVSISTFLASGSTANPNITECQFTDGNGYLFVFHPNLDPFYCTFNSGVITAQVINVKVRDFAGIPEPGVADNFRPSTLSAEHQYNLINQGWTSGTPWTAIGAPAGQRYPSSLGSFVVNISSQTNTTSVTNGSIVSISGTILTGSGLVPYTLIGSVTNYASPFTSITVFLTFSSLDLNVYQGFVIQTENLSLQNVGFINTWFAQIGNYPSNSDVWWLYKNTSNVFNPSTTLANVQQPFGPAAKGSFIMNPFIQNRSAVSNITGLTTVSTTLRPATGTWFQGRVWYAGINASFPPTGDEPYYTWTENIYFSQIVVNTTQFGLCYQTNDPTAQDLFAILPTDGGVITIQGSGSIYKLFPIQNGLLVFAANGIWFITGSQGIGFSANDYTITKLSSIQSISSTSFVNVQGYPMFWNEEGIYYVTLATQEGGPTTQNNRHSGFSVDNLCLGSILSFYANIPLQSKKFVRGDFHPLDYIVQWCYRSTNETTVTSRYQFDSILNFNIATKAFSPYVISSLNTNPHICGINYVAGPGGTGSPNPVFKYLTSASAIGTDLFTFSEERDSTFVDWKSTGVPTNYISFFVTGYRLTGKSLLKFQVPYIYVFSRNPSSNAYYIQSIWDYATDGNSGRWSVKQKRANFPNHFSNIFHRIRLRGRGLVMQIKVSSVDGLPFDLMGWSTWGQTNEQI